MPGGGRGSLVTIKDVFIDVAERASLSEDQKSEIIICLRDIVVAAIQFGGYVLEGYEH